MAEVDLNQILQAEQASNIAAMGRAHTNMMDLQQRAYLKLLTSVDLVEAAAAKELSKAGAGVDLATLMAAVNAGAQTPKS